VNQPRRGAAQDPADAAPLHRDSYAPALAHRDYALAEGGASTPRARSRRGRGLVDLDIPGPGAYALRLVLALLAIVVVLVTAGWAYDSVNSAGKIHPGVRASGVDLGGLTPNEASSRLATQLAPRFKLPITATFENQKWTIAPATIGAELDANGTVDKAMAFGRGGNFFGDTVSRFVAYFAPVDLEASSTVDPNAVNAQLDTLGKAVGIPTTDASVVVDGTSISVKPARPGRELDREAARRGLMAALPKTTDRNVALSVPVRQAGVTEASAQAAADVAKELMAAPATVTYKTRSWTMSPDDIAKSIGFVVVAAGKTSDAASLVPSGSPDPPAGSAAAMGSVALGARIDPVKVAEVLGPRVGGLGRPAKDAQFVTNGGKVTILPDQIGVGPDMRKLARDLTVTLRSPDSSKRVAQLRLGEAQPKLTLAMARTYGITERISTFSTGFGSDNKPRVNNIDTLAKAIDGSLVAPGATWSLNGTVGERTAAKGYLEANAIVGGKLVPQLGGGICQVASTAFNAIFFSGEPVVERQNHSFYISHYPKGRDATVTWGGPDLRFRNDTSNWILIKTAADSTSVTVSLYGTSPGYQVAYTTSELKKTSDFPTEANNDPQLPLGTRVVKDPGIAGYVCTVTRTVTKGGSVVRTDKFVSDYKPKVELVLVGTMPTPAPSKPATPTSGH
jgi:vancomycin resistance protein YoaR